MALANNPRALGAVISVSVLIPPADSPANVTLCGSPPKAAMFRCTPLQGSHLIHGGVRPQRLIPRHGLGESGMGESAKRSQPIVDGHEHDAVARKARTVVIRQRACAHAAAAAVDPNHHRRMRGASRRPHIQRQAIFTRGLGRAAILQDIGHARCRELRTRRPELGGRPRRHPRGDRLRCSPSEPSDRWPPRTERP